MSTHTTLMILSTIEENFVILYVYDWHLNHQFWPDLGGDPYIHVVFSLLRCHMKVGAPVGERLHSSLSFTTYMYLPGTGGTWYL